MQNTNENLVIVFKSRTQTMKFYEYLKRNRISAEIINTPRHLQLGCGLSIKFAAKYQNAVKNLLQDLNLYSYSGIFKY